MSENNALLQSPELAALVEDLRLHRVDRRTFVMRAAASGMAITTASALATDALAQPSAPAPAKQVPPAAGTQQVPPAKVGAPITAQVEIRIPSTIKLPKSDLDSLTAEFNNKLLALINRPGGTGARMAPVNKLQSVTELKSVSVDTQ